MLGEIVVSSYERAKEQQRDEGYIKLVRSFATISLPGINVNLPFSLPSGRRYAIPSM